MVTATARVSDTVHTSPSGQFPQWQSEGSMGLPRTSVASRREVSGLESSHANTDRRMRQAYRQLFLTRLEHNRVAVAHPNSTLR